MLYFIIVTATMAATTVSSVLVARAAGDVPMWHAALSPMTVNIYLLVLLGAVSLLMRVLIPKRFWNGHRECFRVKGWEMSFYKKIRIKKWKDKIPEMGRTGGFPKDHLRSADPVYLERFISETCFGEWMHFTAGVVGFSALLFYPLSDLFFVLPILIVNFFLHLLPCLIQRYNRYRLLRLCRHFGKERCGSGEPYFAAV